MRLTNLILRVGTLKFIAFWLILIAVADLMTETTFKFSEKQKNKSINAGY